MIRQQKNN